MASRGAGKQHGLAVGRLDHERQARTGGARAVGFPRCGTLRIRRIRLEDQGVAVHLPEFRPAVHAKSGGKGTPPGAHRTGVLAGLQ